MANIYDMADTWNDSGTVFTAIKMNVTDTASDVSSLLMDLQVGGTSQLNIRKDGAVFAKSYSTTSGNVLLASFGAAAGAEVGTFGVKIRDSGSFQWSSTSSAIGAADTALYRDAAGILAQRNGTNPQEFRLYNTYTNSTDYERGFMRWNSNTLEIGTEADGTGGNRGIEFHAYGGRQVTITSSSVFFTGLTLRLLSPGTGHLGISSIPWGDLHIRPSSSLTPGVNGGLCIEATNDTTLTFKLKGSDGTVRSGTVTLA